MKITNLQLDFYNRTRTAVAKKTFSTVLKRIQNELLKEKKIKPLKIYSLELSFVGTSEITMLNRLYHGKNLPTDVISLSYFDASMRDRFAGEIFICLPYARAQARMIRQPLEEELKFLFVHGVLHIFGYDHETPRQKARMFGLTYRILGRHTV